LRAATYARYSTDKQREASIDDQDRRSCAFAVQHEWTVVAQYHDDGVSGSTPVGNRRGGATLLADALADRFQVLILEGLDRLSRDLVEQERIVRRLEHLSIRIIGVSDGYDSTSKARKIHRGMRGIINEIYLDDLREKVHRGLDGLVARQLNAGGLPFGYRSIAVTDGRQLEIDEGKADVVRFIYQQYAAGMSPQRIAAELNRRAVPSPRKGTWAVSAIYGSPKKGCGILNNTIYIGRYVWNRSQWLKDPETGKRRRAERPQSEWRRVDLERLRIIPDDLWQAARRRQSGRNIAGRRYPRALLSGLLRCGACGGAVVAVSKYSYGCAARKDRGDAVCAGVIARRCALDSAVLAHIQAELVSEAAERELMTYVRETLRARKLEANSGLVAARSRLEALDREITNLTDAIAQCGFSEALKARLSQAESQRALLLDEQRRDPDTFVPDVIPKAIDRLRLSVHDLAATLKKQPDTSRAALEELLGPITISHEGEYVIAELGGVYEGMLAALSGSQILPVVAGVGFEPTTFGL
jgi:site-specific DNA recombinase